MSWFHKLLGIGSKDAADEDGTDGERSNLELHVTVERVERKSEERRQRLLDLRAAVLTRETTEG